MTTGGAELIQPRNGVLRFFKHRSKHDKIRRCLFRSHDLAFRMTGHANDRRRSRPSFPPDFPNILGGYVVRSKVNSVCANRECDIAPGVDQQLRSRPRNASHGLARQILQRTRVQILFPELDVIHPALSGF